jgi:hypothetical protein
MPDESLKLLQLSVKGLAFLIDFSKSLTLSDHSRKVSENQPNF